jgi:metallo-beta-lactamase family protein
MKITFHGAAQTVTGSRHMISLNKNRLLLDCGLYQGHRKDTYERNLNFPFAPRKIDSVVLSHAHIDHCGNLPNLVRQGYEGPINATQATIHLTDIMTRDAGHIQEADAEYINRKRERRGDPPIEPLYTVADAEQATQFLTPKAYDMPFDPIPGARATLVEAGHILGSAGVILDLEENHRSVRLMFSGDIGRFNLPILRDPMMPPEDLDYLIMECTYGSRSHNPPQQAYEKLHEVVTRTVHRGGKIIIPAFAVGRTQTLVYYLHRMISEGDIPRVPVFVDSPLAINVTDITRAHPECFDKQILEFMRKDAHGSAFGFDLLSYTRSVEESKEINKLEGPAVIISASGMAEVGRILHHLRNNIEDPHNTVLITSWMAPHTLGRRLVEGVKRVKIFGDTYTVNAEVVTINGLSAHAGKELLLKYALQAKDHLKGIFLVHGEPESAAALMESIKEQGFDKVQYPELGTEVEI